jgi:hypothetical protein
MYAIERLHNLLPPPVELDTAPHIPALADMHHIFCDATEENTTQVGDEAS